MNNSLRALAVIVGLALLTSCREKEPAQVGEVEVTREVEVTLLGLEEAIDWNREMALISGDAYLQWASEESGIDVATLDKAIRLEFDPERNVISVIATDREESTASKYATAVATSLKLARLKAEMKAVAPGPAEEGPLESDRMTYEKARKALEEEPSSDRVLYRKKE